MDEFIEIVRTIMQLVQDNIDEFNDQELQQIGQFLQKSFDLIQKEAQEQRPIETPSEALQLTPGGFPSSNINAFKFNPDTKELLIQFHGPYPQAAGPVYSYADVPEFLFKVLERGAVGPKTSGQNQYHRWIKGVTPSLGAAVNALIKAGGFAYNRIA